MTVDEAQAGQRLDRILAAGLADLSRARIQQLLGEGHVTRDGVTIKDANHRVKGGETYEVSVPAAAAAKPMAQDIPLDVVYEDKDLIVIEKPAGLVVHPAAGNPDGTLVNALIAHCGASLMGIGGEARPGIVHRLDKDTSGLLVAAKTERAMGSLAKQFANHTIERAYHAAGLGGAAGDGRGDRRPDRAQPLRPQAHGGAERRRQAGPHPLPGAGADSDRRRAPSLP